MSYLAALWLLKPFPMKNVANWSWLTGHLTHELDHLDRVPHWDGDVDWKGVFEPLSKAFVSPNGLLLTDQSWPLIQLFPPQSRGVQKRMSPIRWSLVPKWDSSLDYRGPLYCYCCCSSSSSSCPLSYLFELGFEMTCSLFSLGHSAIKSSFHTISLFPHVLAGPR